MIENATVYNSIKTQIHADALRLRDVVESFTADETGTATPNGRPRRRAAEEAATPSRPASTRGAKTLAAMKDIQAAIIDDLWNMKDAKYEYFSFPTSPAPHL